MTEGGGGGQGLQVPLLPKIPNSIDPEMRNFLLDLLDVFRRLKTGPFTFDMGTALRLASDGGLELNSSGELKIKLPEDTLLELDSNGIHSLKIGPVLTFSSSDVNATTNEITITGHGLTTGILVQFYYTNGTLPAPLAKASVYSVVKVDNNKFTLKLAGVAVDITNVGSGSHKLFVISNHFLHLVTAIGGVDQYVLEAYP